MASWNEVGQNHQSADGSVKAFPVAGTNLPTFSNRLHQASAFSTRAPASRGGSCSSDKSTPVGAREGDISGQSSEEWSDSKRLLMPSPMRKDILPSLFRDTTGKTKESSDPISSESEILLVTTTVDPYERGERVGMEQHGQAWTVQSLVKYLKKNAKRIHKNIQLGESPTNEALDTFIEQLVHHVKKHLKTVPRQYKTQIKETITSYFQKFWKFTDNKKVQATTPEELACTLDNLATQLLASFPNTPVERNRSQSVRGHRYHRSSHRTYSGQVSRPPFQ